MDISADRALTALEEIGRANPEDLVRGLNAVFCQIVKMDEGQVIAAWQTLDFCATRFSSESEQRKIIEKFQEAIVNRMVAIAHTSPLTRTSQSFSGVVGERFDKKFLT